MKKLFILLCLITPFFLYGQTDCGAENQLFPSLEPFFIEEKQSSQLTPEEIIKYGLRFSTCLPDTSGWTRCLSKYSSLESQAIKAFSKLPDEEKADKLLAFMYENLLEQYKEQQTRLDVMFQDGTYNCVSSSLLYMALAKAVGLKVSGIKTPSHAFCTVLCGEKEIDVETTNPFGFNPGRTQVLEQTGAKTKYAVIPKKNYAERRKVSEKTFISLAGSNMASWMMGRDDYSAAVPMVATVMVFRNGENSYEITDGRECFDTVALNYSVILDKKGQYVQAIQWIDRIIEKYGLSDKTRGELNGAIYNAAVEFTNSGNFVEAEKIYEDHKGLISDNFDFQVRKMIFISRIQERLDKLENGEALEYLEAQYDNPLASEKSVKTVLDKWRDFYFVERINSLIKEGKYLEAAAQADQDLKLMPGSYNIRKAKGQALYNFDATVHNEMAKLANAKQYKKALEVVDLGLEKNPGSATLQNDRKRLLQMMNR